jgi:hypothetical protein
MSKSNRRDVKTVYEPLEKHPDNLKPPYPCNRWCNKLTKTHDGEIIETVIMPWLDECMDMKISCGAVPGPDGPIPAFRPHRGFDEIDYVVVEENAFKYDANNEIIMEKNEETGAEHPVSAFKYVSGINAVNFIAEHLFRVAGMSVNSSRQTMGAIQAMNNNLVQLCKIQSASLKGQLGETPEEKKIEAPAAQSALPPSGPRIVT